MKAFLNKLEEEHIAKGVLPVNTNTIETLLNSKHAKVPMCSIIKMQ